MRRLKEERENYDEYVSEYGQEYLSENDPDSAPWEMEEFNELTNYEPLEAITRAFYGGRYGFKNDSFNPNDEYFAYNGYGNLISIAEYDLTDYIRTQINESDFLEWLENNGYIDEDSLY